MVKKERQKGYVCTKSQQKTKDVKSQESRVYNTHKAEQTCTYWVHVLYTSILYTEEIALCTSSNPVNITAHRLWY